MKSIKIFVIALLGLAIYSCKSSRGFLAENAEQALSQHHQIAVLPFYVVFSQDFKSISQGAGRRNQNQTNWREQERLAGLDLQTICFKDIAKRAVKKGLPITVQDFLTTNKLLESNNIKFSELKAADKGALARILGVDAVVWGETNTEFTIRSYGNRNGVRSQLSLIDAKNGQMVWQNSTFQYMSSRLDSPQSLASNAVSQLVSTMPYVAMKK